MRQKAYNTTAWKKMRLDYLKQHPCCEECLRNGIVTPAVDVHHLKSPFRGGEINYDMLLDSNNLEALCKECHALEHQKEKGYVTPEQVIAQLDALFDENITDEELDGYDN